MAIAKESIQYPVYSMQYKEFKIRNTEYQIPNTHRGFTLIELLVVVAIIVVITSVTLVSNTKYGGSVLLQNLAYDIALSIRQAQVYGISVRGYGSGQFNAGYGMHFSMNDTARYELFADKDNDGRFDSDDDPTVSENIPPSPYVIGRNYRIAKLCAPAGTKLSDHSYNCTSVEQLDIVFNRPDPDARITAGDGSGESCVQSSSQCKASARIVVQSPRGDVLSVVVEAPGQIAVE